MRVPNLMVWPGAVNDANRVLPRPEIGRRSRSCRSTLLFLIRDWNVHNNMLAFRNLPLDVAVLAGFSILTLAIASRRFSQEAAVEPMNSNPGWQARVIPAIVNF